MAYTRRRRVYRRKSTGRRYKKAGAMRRTLRGSEYYKHPLSLLGLRRHFSGSSGGPKRSHFPRYVRDDPEDYRVSHDWSPPSREGSKSPLPVYDKNNDFIRKSGRFGLDMAGRHGRALLYALPYNIPFKEQLGDALYWGANKLGQFISPNKFESDNKVGNALLSFVDGEDRPGSVNQYTEMIGKGFSRLANPQSANQVSGYFNKAKLYGDFAKVNLIDYMKPQNLPKSLLGNTVTQDTMRNAQALLAKQKLKDAMSSYSLKSVPKTLSNFGQPLEAPSVNRLQDYNAKALKLQSIPFYDIDKRRTTFTPDKWELRRSTLALREASMNRRVAKKSARIASTPTPISYQQFKDAWGDEPPPSPYKPYVSKPKDIMINNTGGKYYDDYGREITIFEKYPVSDNYKSFDI